MTFISSELGAKHIVPPSGKKSSKICLIGEAPGSEEARQLKPFVGPAGTILESCMHSAGFTRSEVYMTNVVKVQPRANDITPFFNKKSFTEAGHEWVEILHEELKDVGANILVPLGNTALAAITDFRSITKYRGYILQGGDAVDGRKVLPTIHPSAALRGNYMYRYYIANDLKKAKGESGFPEILRPARTLVYQGDCEEFLAWCDYFTKVDIVSFDIEVINYEVSCISFSDSPERSVSIPIAGGQWNLDDEIRIWKGISRVLENPRSTKVGQNLVFDIHFLATRCGILVQGPIHDTMIAHHLMYPDMLKGLGFLVSCYCGSQSYYKDMVKFENIKEES